MRKMNKYIEDNTEDFNKKKDMEVRKVKDANPELKNKKHKIWINRCEVTTPRGRFRYYTNRRGAVPAYTINWDNDTGQ